MKKIRWRKWTILAMAAGLLCGQLTVPVRAGELPEEVTGLPEVVAESSEEVVKPDTGMGGLWEEENSGAGEVSVSEYDGQASGIAWKKVGDTLIVTGEGPAVPPEGTSIGFKSAMIKDGIKYVKFEDCKIIGTMRVEFAFCDNLIGIDFSGLDTSQVTDMSLMFWDCDNLASLDLSSFDTRNVTDMSGMFDSCSSLTGLDLSSFDTRNVTDMSGMFDSCSSLTGLDLSSFDTRNVTDMSGMFDGCSSLTGLDLSNFDTRNVTDMSSMFDGCDSLIALDISNFDTGNVTNMSGMFAGCSSLPNLDVMNFDTNNVTSMYEMFEECSLSSLDLSDFDTSNVTDMTRMFYNCSNLTSVDVSSFNTSSVMYMGMMFENCSSLTSIDVSNFNTENVATMWNMFYGCSGLTSVDVSGFNAGKVEEMQDMFFGCDSLVMLFSPYHVNHSVLLPVVSNAVWRCPDGTEITELPQNLDYSVALTRYDISETPTPTPTPAPVNPPTDDAVQKVQDFVSRMYTVALNRDAETQGLNDWTNRLLTHEIDGAGIANGFIMSEEFTNRDLNDGEFVDVLYRTFFNREADAGGRANWLAELASGKTRGYVLSGFVNSTEFDNLCDSYGLARGIMREDGSPVNAGVRQFVERCYTKVLGRAGEKAGLEDWTNRIVSGQMSAEDVAKSFFFSDEYTNKKTDNETFVETLYQTFMDRASDTAGKADWLGRLNGGTSRQQVLEGFSRSAEFAEILAGYGL